MAQVSNYAEHLACLQLCCTWGMCKIHIMLKVGQVINNHAASMANVSNHAEDDQVSTIMNLTVSATLSIWRISTILLNILSVNNHSEQIELVRTRMMAHVDNHAYKKAVIYHAEQNEISAMSF
jgi:hypothetical protein